MTQAYENLLQARGDQIHFILKQYYYQKGIKNTIAEVVKYYKECQLCKVGNKNFNNLSLKNNVLDIVPWRIVCMGIIGLQEIQLSSMLRKKEDAGRKQERNQQQFPHQI